MPLSGIFYPERRSENDRHKCANVEAATRKNVRPLQALALNISSGPCKADSRKLSTAEAAMPG